MRRVLTAAIAAAVTMSALSACSSGDDSGPGTVTTLVTVTRSPSSAVPTSSATTSSTAVTAYTPTSTRVTGRTDRASYDVAIPQLAGGNPAVTGEFNQSMRAALQDQIDADYSGMDFTLRDGYRKGPFHIGARVVSAESISYWMANPPGAHGDSLLATVTIDADTAQPITLSDAFSDLGTGLRRLSQESARILPTTVVGDRYERSGITPEEKNFANWTASPDGMQIHFGDYQVGAYADGLVTITIPWSDLSDVLAPGMQDVLSS
ncbi:MAG: RsiV family protein [Gordonia paraffinivorans]